MAIPVYLWLEDQCGRAIKGSVNIKNREGSIEVIELMHSVKQPVDKLTGRITAKRIYSSYAFMKKIDASFSYLGELILSVPHKTSHILESTS